MYAISDLYQQYLMERSRTWLVKVTIGSTDYDSTTVVDFTVENDMAGQQEFELGTAILSKLTLHIKTSDVIAPNARVVPYLALQLPDELDGANVAWQDAAVAWQDAAFPWQGNVTEWLPLGEFFVDSRKQVNDVWEFTCYDRLVYADVAYVSSLTYPTSMQAVWDEIIGRLGFAYDSSVVIDPGYQIQAGPAGYTMRQVLGYIAGANGACVYVSKDGIIRFKRFGAADEPVTALTDDDYIQVKQTNPTKTYTRVVVTYDTEDELSYSAGSGDDNHTLQVENPFVTQAITDDLLAQLNGFSYTPIKMPARGYPQFEVGDRIRYGVPADSPTWDTADVAWQDADFTWDGYASGGGITMALNIAFSFKGGLSMSLDAPSKSEQLSEFGIDGSLSTQINKLNQNAVKQGKSYFGATITRTEGLTIEREDHASKVILNSDKMSFQVGGVDKIYFDPVTGKYKFNGTLEAADGVFSGSLSAATGTFGGIYTGTIKANQIDVSSGKITAGQIDATSLHVSAANIDGTLTAAQIDATNLHVAAANITGTLTASQIDATNLHVAAANITGTLTAGQINTSGLAAEKIYQVGSPSNYTVLGGSYGDMVMYYNNSEFFRIYNAFTSAYFISRYNGVQNFFLNADENNVFPRNSWNFSNATVSNISISGVTNLQNSLNAKLDSSSQSYIRSIASQLIEMQWFDNYLEVYVGGAFKGYLPISSTP